MKKAQGLPITTIVVAALALLVLVILFAITTGRLGIFTGAASECQGVCVVSKLPQGMSPGGGLEVPRANTTRPTAACTGYEKRVYGNYIAGIRTPDNKPIPCSVCCVSTIA